MAEDNTNRFLKVQEVIAKNRREMRELRASLDGVEVPVENPPEEDARPPLAARLPAPVAKKQKKPAKKRKPADRK